MNFESWEDYEGLVHGTIKKHGVPPEMEREDVEQILRAKVVEALNRFDPKQGLAQKNYVFGCVLNQMRDLLRKKPRFDVSIHQFEDSHTRDSGEHGQPRVGRARELKIGLVETEEEAFAEVLNDEPVHLPNTLTGDEHRMATLLSEGATPTEVMEELGLNIWVWSRNLKSLKLKLADWNPSPVVTDDDIEDDAEIREVMEEAPVGH